MIRPSFFLAAVTSAGLSLTQIATADLVSADLNTGGADTGFSGGWVGSNQVFISAAPDLFYPSYGITQTGTTQQVYTGNTNSGDRMDSRNLATAMTGEIWFSALVNVPATGNFTGLAFDANSTTSAPDTYSHALSELRVLLTPTQLIVDMTTGAPTATGTETGTFAAGITHLILGKMIIGAGNDSIDVWIDPNIGAINPHSPGLRTPL